MPIRAAALASGLLLAACSGGGGGGASAPAPAAPVSLTQEDVRRVIAQAVGEAQARGVQAHVAVVDRVGNVLATFEMAGAPATIAIRSGLGVSGGLDGLEAGVIPAALSAIAKAVTGAYLSSQGNAFSTRTASQIVQEHFNPQESQQPSGPLYGVQFSQLSCSDVNRNESHGSVGPKRSPLGLSADPGGLPIYKNGVLVGGVGIESDGVYGLDRDITDLDQAVEEQVAVAATAGMAAPDDIRGDRITADGRTFRFVDSESPASDPSQPPPFATLPGALVAVAGYSTAAVRAGTAFGTPASGIVPDISAAAIPGSWILVDAAGANRFPPSSATGQQPAVDTGDLQAAEVRTLLAEALAVANRARAQIRRPLGSPAHVTISVVDANGNLLGLVRTGDGPVFGIDVAVQKARTAMAFSSSSAVLLRMLPPAMHLNGDVIDVGRYITDTEAFLSPAPAGAFPGGQFAFTGQIAWTTRAIGNLHRPFYPDGLDTGPTGPLSTPISRWSPFNVGFQLDAIYNQLVRGVLGDTSEGCTGRRAAGDPTPETGGIARLRNGPQIFPGGVPIYRGSRLVGGLGVSGDGVDQDDMIAYLGLLNGSQVLATGLGHAPAAMRADLFTPHDARLRYVQCPQAPFNDSSEQNVCG